jgi:trigger factor
MPSNIILGGTRMSTKVEKLENNLVKLEVTVGVEDFKAAIKKAYKKNAGKYNVPGFRKGKTPQPIIEKYYGEGIFFEEAVNIICDDTYPAAIKENELSPVDYPELDVVQIGKDKDLIYTATVAVKPEVVLGQYKGIEVTKKTYEVDAEEISKELNSMREKNARIVVKEEGTLQNGDIAIIDFEGFVGAIPFEGGKGENYELTLGSGTFIPGFEEQLVGASLNETKNVEVTFPEEYHSEELKGRSATFKVTVKGIKVKEMPELDDELVKDISEFDTVEELKADLNEKQKVKNEEKATKEVNEGILDKVAELSSVEIPEVMVTREVDYMVQDLDYRLQYQGLSIDKYVELIGTTMDAMKKDFAEPAKKKVKMNLVLEAIAKAENITASDEEIEKRAEEIAHQYGEKDIEKMKKAILSNERAAIYEEVLNNKVIELLVSESIVTA